MDDILVSIDDHFIEPRVLATDVEVIRMPREEWGKRNEAAGIGVFGA